MSLSDLQRRCLEADRSLCDDTKVKGLQVLLNQGESYVLQIETLYGAEVNVVFLRVAVDRRGAISLDDIHIDNAQSA